MLTLPAYVFAFDRLCAGRLFSQFIVIDHETRYEVRRRRRRIVWGLHSDMQAPTGNWTGKVLPLGEHTGSEENVPAVRTPSNFGSVVDGAGAS